MMQSERIKKTLISKENAYSILKAFAKEYKKQNKGHTPLEIVIVGGGSIMLNYGFREYTQDFDVLTQSRESIKSAAYRIAEMFNLRDDWMNTDFVHTSSYSDKLREVSKYYCSFNNNNSIEFRTVNAEYLIAMKMVSAREYRNDISDVVGILIGLKREDKNFSMDRIDFAINHLYGNPQELIKAEVYCVIQKYVQYTVEELEKEYEMLTQAEEQVREKLILANEDNPGTVTEETIDDILELLRKRKNDNVY